MGFFVPPEAAATGVQGGGAGPAQDGVFRVECLSFDAGDERFFAGAHFLHVEFEDGTQTRQLENAPFDEDGKQLDDDEGRHNRSVNRANAMALSFDVLDEEQGYTDEFFPGRTGYVVWAAGDQNMKVFGRIQRYVTKEEYERAQTSGRVTDYTNWRLNEKDRADKKAGRSTGSSDGEDGGDTKRPARPTRAGGGGGGGRPARPTRAGGGGSSGRPKPPRPTGRAAAAGTPDPGGDSAPY